MSDLKRRETYRRIWTRVKEVYDTGYVVSEAGLQAALYAELRTEFPKDRIVVEPTWERGGNIFPDLVAVSEEPAITDIFELKFVPHYYPVWQKDIEKLLQYSGNVVAEYPTEYPIRLEPSTGTWEGPVRVAKNCRLHFVAVGQHDAEAVCPAAIAKVPGVNGAVNFWYGRVGNGEWDIQFVS